MQAVLLYIRQQLTILLFFEVVIELLEKSWEFVKVEQDEVVGEDHTSVVSYRRG